jgi:two-component system sensor histidine kinase KdpD
VDFARERNASHLVLAGCMNLGAAGCAGVPASLSEQIACWIPAWTCCCCPSSKPDSTLRLPAAREKAIPWKGYAGVTLACLAATAVAELLLQVFDPANVVMLFLLVVVLSAVRWGRGPGHGRPCCRCCCSISTLCRRATLSASTIRNTCSPSA